MFDHNKRYNQRRPDTELETEQHPRTPLQLHVPNDVGEVAIQRFVEGVISTLKRERVGVEYTSTTLFGVKRTQYLAQGDGTTVQKRMYDPRLGWRETSVRQLTVQDDLVARLTLDQPVEDGQWARRRDVCRVRPIDVLRTR
ncbi:hypothetical protein [Halarchaeum nitratireducens]|uniref:DUF8030 domain-containing protein n=1 Tax=Halarchaeum nitratireducens TaxID=489913 RepID=A0A830GEL1_9EURY|nr:hypothetical protein [Halarchaeum nitratireducens]GGN23906.1 hypothetical protein GCM10009021_26900 [Halarchaeum nitratireducens]